jgi:hypothetical protein
VSASERRWLGGYWVYDAAHLARHPGQTIAALQLTWKGFEAGQANRARAVLNARSRSGRTIMQALIC